MRGRRFSAVSLAYVLIVASIAGTPLVLGTGTASANTSAGDTTYAVGQSGQCKAEITPLGDGSLTGPEYYDYRGTDAGLYASHGTTDVQESDVSQLYVYDGSDGTSLVFLHDELGDEQNGGAVTFNVSGLPTDGDWKVEDDNYTGRDDNFDHSGSESQIDWMWADNRTDGAMFLGLESNQWSEITVDPAFGEESWAANERDFPWQHADEGPQEWQARNRSGDTTSLDMSERISFRAGDCSAVSPTAALSGPDNASADETVTLAASSPDSPTTPIEYRWDFENDGQIDETTTSTTVEHSYSDSGEMTAAVTVVDRFGQTATATKNISIDGNSPPTAVASVPASATVGEDVTVDASGSSDDEGIVSYEWDFGDGTTATGVNATHAYGAAGNYTVTLTVTDGEGLNDTTTETIEIEESAPSNRAPTVELSADPTSVTVGENVTLEADASDPDGDSLTYNWTQLSGPASLDLPSGDSGNVTPSAAGSYEVRVTAEDPDGANDSDSVTFEVVAQNQAPDAAFDWSPTNPAPSEDVTFDASNSSDDGTIETYEWDFDDDGQTDATGETANWTFDSAGEYPVTLRVVDDDGANDSATEHVQVGEANQPPTIDRIETSPDPIQVGEPATFSGFANDSDGSIASYHWDFDSDGQTDETGQTVEHTFATGGDRTVELTVTDDEGASTSGTTTVSVNRPPTAALDANATVVTPGETVALDATGSNDPDGDELTYTWRVVSAPSGANVSPPTGPAGEATLQETGEYTFEVNVSDGTRSDAATTTVEVAEDAERNEAPTAAFDWSPTDPKTGETVSLDASGSSDADGSIASYEWDVGADGSYEKTGVDPTVTFDSAGSHDVRLQVTDDRGATDTIVRTVEVAEPDQKENEPPKAVLVASDTRIRMTNSVTLDASGSSDPDGADDALAFDWAVTSAPKGATLPAFDPAPTNEVSFDETGTYEVRVTVEDAEGGTDSATETIEVFAKPSLHVDNISIDDDHVEVEEKAEFDVLVHNAGHADGEMTLKLTVDGEAVRNKTVQVGPREEETFTLVHCFERPGNYTVSIHGESVEPVDVQVSAPEHALEGLSIAGDDGATLDAGSSGSLAADVDLVVESDVVTKEQLTAALANLSTAEFDATVGTDDATVTDVSAGDPVRKDSKWLIPLELVVDAPSNDAGAHDLTVAFDLPHACWPIADSDCEAGSSIATTGEDLVVYEATSSSNGGSGGGSSGSHGGSSSGSSAGSSSNADDAAGQEDPTTSDDADEGTESPTSTVTSTSEETSTPEATTVEEPTTQDSSPSATETESPGQPGFGVGLAVLAMLSAALLARLRD